MDYRKNRKSDLPFSLHDSRIVKIEMENDNLILKMDRIFQYSDGEEKWFQGVIEFTKTDLEECKILVFHTPYGYEGENSFSGESLSFEEFKKRYPEAEFEIVTEGYSGYDTTYQGGIWQGENAPFFGIMCIWNRGDMIYRI
ncbi:hypothetical protein SAMN02910358_02143 [Lachnospiraceae bacterium XBB1006]|nr:hypothetical protein SAMN02910358_02143 [Lachnospiraceae bacterium XBB1006]